MLSGFAALCIAFVLVSSDEAFSLGAGLFLLTLTLGFGVLAFAFMTHPEELLEGALKEIMAYSERDPLLLVSEVESAAGTVRQEGLLSMESAVSGIHDDFLKFLLQKLARGFDKAQLVSLIRNQLYRKQELLSISQNYFDRVSQAVVTWGLFLSVLLMANSFRLETPNLTLVFVPFLLGVVLHLAFQMGFQEKLIRALDRSRLYYFVLEESVSGIHEGLAPELLADKLNARLKSGWRK